MVSSSFNQLVGLNPSGSHYLNRGLTLCQHFFSDSKKSLECRPGNAGKLLDDHQPEKKFPENSDFFRRETESAAYIRQNLRNRREGPGKPLAITTLTCYKDYNEISMRSQTNLKQTNQPKEIDLASSVRRKSGLFYRAQISIKTGQHDNGKSTQFSNNLISSIPSASLKCNHFIPSTGKDRTGNSIEMLESDTPAGYGKEATKCQGQSDQ